MVLEYCAVAFERENLARNLPHLESGQLMRSTMKTFLLFTVLLVPVSLGLGIGTKGEKFIEVKVEPALKFYDSNGGEILMASDNENHRFIRRASTCKIPPKTTDSLVECKLYSSKIFCNHTCIFGHTFKEGPRRQMSCKYEDDKWSPVPSFEKCKPFVDCTLTLGPGGKYKCRTNYMEQGPTCQVSCADYEDVLGVPEDMYQCDIQGQWTPKLPFCATPGSGVILVPPPKG